MGGMPVDKAGAMCFAWVCPVDADVPFSLPRARTSLLVDNDSPGGVQLTVQTFPESPRHQELE